GARLIEKKGKQFMKIAGKLSHRRSSENSDDDNQHKLLRSHATYLQFLPAVFFSFGGVRPPPPSGNVCDEEEGIEKHIRIKLNLVEKKEEKNGIDDSHRPVEDAGPG